MKNLFLSLFIVSLAFSAQAQTIVGTWKTIDDRTGEAKSYVKIYKAKNGLYYGKIIKLLNRPADEPKDPKCLNCPENDYRHNQSIIGMAVLSKLKANKDLTSATSGKVLDPEVGKIFDCKISVTADGKKLKMRGYLGVPTLGRTQTWVRVK